MGFIVDDEGEDEGFAVVDVTVGMFVGATGDGVGAGVGLLVVGCGVGLLVGEGVGAIVVGVDVGSSVGTAEGIPVGDKLLRSEGDELGAADGISVIFPPLVEEMESAKLFEVDCPSSLFLFHGSVKSKPTAAPAHIKTKHTNKQISMK